MVDLVGRQKSNALTMCQHLQQVEYFQSQLRAAAYWKVRRRIANCEQVGRTCARQCAARQAQHNMTKLIATKRGRVLLVGRRRDKLCMFPGGRKRAEESEKQCLRREIKE